MEIKAVKVSSKIGKMFKKPVPEVVLDLYYYTDLPKFLLAAKKSTFVQEDTGFGGNGGGGILSPPCCHVSFSRGSST